MATLLDGSRRVSMSWARYLELDADTPGEYFDGSLVVAPSPDQQHQLVCLRLAAVLLADVPDGYTVNVGWQWSPATGQNFIPYVVVYAATAETARLTATPVLAVEVLSSNRADDLVVKTSRYAAAGLSNYCIVDRAAGELIAYRLYDGAYEQSQIVGSDAAELSFGIAAVTVSMADLLR